jgi:hypothetical protein
MTWTAAQVAAGIAVATTVPPGTPIPIPPGMPAGPTIPIGIPTTAPPIGPRATIQQGSSGPDVVLWQTLIGVTPDGKFGPATAAATKTWQLQHGITPDGIVGPMTWAAAQQTVQYTDWVANTSVGFQTYWMDNGTPYSDWADAGFAVYSGTSWVNVYPGYQDDATQAAAVAGQIIAMHQGTSGMGIVGGSYFIHANEGCAALDPPTDSCYEPSVFPYGVVHLGTTSIGGTAEAYWKYIIAHEIGHYIQDRAMGEHRFPL